MLRQPRHLMVCRRVTAVRIETAALPLSPYRAVFTGRHCWGCRTSCGGEGPHLVFPSCAGTKAAGPTRDHLSLFTAADRLRYSLSAPWNRRGQRVTSRVDRAVVITRHALAAGPAGGAPCDRAVVQQNPRTGVDIQSYRASSGQCL
jgi:hypothetical protein